MDEDLLGDDLVEDDLTERERLFAEALVDPETLTLVLVRGGTREEVLGLLGAEAAGGGGPFPDDEAWSAYAVTEVAGGVVAFEHTGQADPHASVLAALSALGGSAAVCRSDIEAHDRFGCAQDGRVLFDADEFIFADAADKTTLPAALLPLFDAAWVDLEAEDDDDHDDHDHAASAEAAFAMALLHTGLEVSGEDLRRAVELGYHRVRSGTFRDGPGRGD